MSVLLVAGVFAAEKERPKFTPGPASSYACKQTIQNVTVAAEAVIRDSEAEAAFGKNNPNRQGILPILLVIENGTDKAITLENLKVELVSTDRQRVEASRPEDLKYLRGAVQPNPYPSPIPGGGTRVKRRKNPLADWTIEGRAFTARMLPPKDSASGFFYFRAPFRGGSTLYVTGLREAQTGKELFYFEIPLDEKPAESR